jgi:hypothetical protein
LSISIFCRKLRPKWFHKIDPREKKRQEELKKEEERLKRERLKIEQEKRAPASLPASLPAAAGAQTTAAVSTAPVATVASMQSMQRNGSNASQTSANVNSRNFNASHPAEKGQMDNRETEVKKVSHQRSGSELAPKLTAPVEPMKKPLPAPAATFQPKPFLPADQAPVKPNSLEKPLAIQPAANFAPVASHSNAPADGRAEREEQVPIRVTGLGEFSPMGWLFTLFFENYRSTYCIFMDYCPPNVSGMY